MGREGQEEEFRVLTRNQGNNQDDGAILIQIDDSMDYCYVCRSDRNPHLMMICDLCDFMVAHTYCCGFSEFPEDWLCDGCQRLMGSDEDESSEVMSSSSESESAEEVEYRAGARNGNFRRDFGSII